MMGQVMPPMAYIAAAASLVVVVGVAVVATNDRTNPPITIASSEAVVMLDHDLADKILASGVTTQANDKAVMVTVALAPEDCAQLQKTPGDFLRVLMSASGLTGDYFKDFARHYPKAFTTATAHGTCGAGAPPSVVSFPKE